MSSPLDGNGVATADIAAPVIRFVIFVSWGNDSIALVQWAKENELDGVACVYTDTGWAADGWMDRVERERRDEADKRAYCQRLSRDDPRFDRDDCKRQVGG